MKEKLELLLSYLNTNVSPVLVDFVSSSDLQGSVILDAKIDKSELCGHYEGKQFVAPKWLTQLVTSKESNILVIDKIDSIPKEEQLKFHEILKYRKVSIFNLPENCIIVITADKINKDTINENIFSLVAKI